MRHAGEVVHKRQPVHGLAKRQRERPGALLKLLAADPFGEIRLAQLRTPVRKLDLHSGIVWAYGNDAQLLHAEFGRQVPEGLGNAVRPQILILGKPVLRDQGTALAGRDFRLDSFFPQFCLNAPGNDLRAPEPGLIVAHEVGCRPECINAQRKASAGRGAVTLLRILTVLCVLMCRPGHGTSFA